ncbi:MAG: thiamine diphosphokinase [Tateyamaria sp.]
MNDSIVHSFDPVTLLGGGEASIADVHAAHALAPMCVGADGGAELARIAGVELDAIVGDFDSISQETLETVPLARRLHMSEQDSTDFSKALRYIHAPVVVGVGFLGARLDHQLAALHVLAAHPDRSCVLLGPHEIAFLCPPQVHLKLEKSEVVSLFPLAPVTGTSKGLRWDIEGLAFDPTSFIGTSNEAFGPLTLTMNTPAMIVMLPRAHLAQVTQALARAPQAARWPVRAAQYKAPTQL